MEERLHLFRNGSARFFLDIAAAVRKDFALVDIPDFFQISADFFIKNGLAIYFCFYITGRRVNFSHLRVFIHIRTPRPRGLVRILTADAVFFASLAEICDVIFSLIGFEYDIFSLDTELFYQKILNRVQLLQITDR